MTTPVVLATRVFLGWDRALLHTATEWLLAQGDALRHLTVAVPGSQARRRLLELLVEGGLPDGVPPRIVTAGVLVDELVGPRGRVAGRVARTLAWADALASLPAERLAELVPNPPAAEDLRGWRELGAMARTLHGTLAAAHKDFGDAVEPAGRLGSRAEALRWRVLGLARDRYLERLARDGVVDPHESRRDAVLAAAHAAELAQAGGSEARGDADGDADDDADKEKGDPHAPPDGSTPAAFQRDARVVLVGVVEAGDEQRGSLLRAALATLDTPPTALIFAPESEDLRFDALGCVRPVPADGVAPPVPLELERWFVEDRPADQADRALRCLAALGGSHPASRITVGLLDAQVGPPLARRLADQDVTVRDVAGTPVTRSGPAHLLAATAEWLRGRSVDAFAALVRHPDLRLDGGDDDPSLPVPPPDLEPGVTRSLFDEPPGPPLPPGDLAPAGASARAGPSATSGARCLASDLDVYRAVHLPESVRGPWLAQGSELDETAATPRQMREAADERDRRRALAAAARAWEQQLGELARGRPRPLAQGSEPLRSWLAAVYGARELKPQAREADRRLATALRALAGGLDELASATAWTRPVSAADAVEELLGALASAIIPPAPADDAVELQGWLELPLDDAPVLVLTGVNDGRLPEPIGDLPEALAAELGLPDDGARLARDAFLLTAMLHAREQIWLITGRRSVENDPLRPSRLLFACDDEELPERVAKLVAGGSVRKPAEALPPMGEVDGDAPARGADGADAITGDGAEANARSDAHADGDAAAPAQPFPGSRSPVERLAPRMPTDGRGVDHLSVTAFARYLASPYGFYLDRVLHLRGMDDGVAEMDPLVFGTLAHAVLEGLAGHAAGRSTMADVVDTFLQERLDLLATERFGSASRGKGKGKSKSEPLPAVTLQLMHLRARLSAFARWQANWAADGWRIRHAEWAPTAPVTLDVDGEPFRITGVIDRIDENPGLKRWAILDYKTSEGGGDPAKTHRASVADPTPDDPKRRTRVWTDLQLPLYRVLAAELELPADVRLGYLNLPADLDRVGAVLVPQEGGKEGRRSWEGWTPALLATAEEAAKDVIRKVRAGAYLELGQVARPRADEPIVRALAGLDLLSAPAPDVSDDDEGGSDGGGDGP